MYIHDSCVTVSNTLFCRIKKVSLQDVVLAHLVAYDHDKDLLPMLYAHCNYSLEIGQGTIIDYNFPALERQLVDSLIRGKPMINIEVSSYYYYSAF